MIDPLEVIPLGGLGEFGMNCAALRCGGDMIVVDAGMGFPHTDQGAEFGVQVIVPEISFLKQNSSQLRGIVLTHGHEDHAGAVSFIVNELSVPVYGSRLTLGIVAGRLEERGLLGAVSLVEVSAGQTIDFGRIQVEPVHLTHSYPDNFGLIISTPIGTVIWTGDFKFDQTPIDGKASALHRLAAEGHRGVLALFSDSTNSASPGLSASESTLYEPLRNLFRRAEGRIVASTFASNINRIQVLMDLAQEFDRFVAPIGRSMVSNVRIARELGYLTVPSEQVLSLGETTGLPRHRVMVLASGSQGEPMSALSRIAIDQVKGFRVEEGDSVILSARIIPGNEKLIASMLNHFYRRGARVFDTTQNRVHVSGHGFEEDLKLMINLTRPRFFVPIHGEYRQLKTHAWIAQKQGIAEQNVKLIENGDILQLTPESAEVRDKISIGRRFIDDGILEEVHEVVLRDRKFLSEDGFLIVILRLNRLTGDLIGEPEIVSRGFVMIEESEDLMTALRERILAVVRDTSAEEKRDNELFNEIVRKELRRYLKKSTGKRPLVISLTMEI